MRFQLVKNQIATCIAVHEKLLVVGTASGYVWTMDHLGHVDHQNVPIIRPHRCPVTCLSIDEPGNYVLSCANDGRVVASGIGTSGKHFKLNLNFMPRSIAICPSFSRPNAAQMFIVGERNLMLYERKSSFIETFPCRPIFRGAEKDGFITMCSWSEPFIAMTNDAGTSIYDRTEDKMITLVTPSHDVDRIRSSRIPPAHCWLSPTSLAIGWADTITIVVIAEGEKIDNKIQPKRGEVHYQWNVSMLLSGISFVSDPQTGEWKEIVALGLQPASDDATLDEISDQASTVSISSDSALIPAVQVSVLAPFKFDKYHLISEDRISLNIPKRAQPFQFNLIGLSSYEIHFIMGPRDLVIASPYCASESVKWRVENGMWEEAWQLAKQKASELDGTIWDQRSVGREMLKTYVDEGRPKLAVALLREVCGDSRAEWEWAVGLFENARLSTLLAEVLPTGNPQLEPECYQSVLQAALYNDMKLYKRLVQTWSPDLYRTGAMVTETLQRIQEIAQKGNTERTEEENSLYQVLAHLYVYERKFELALKIYMANKDQQIFSVIDKYQLFEYVKEDITGLMEINSDRALRLLLDNADSVPPSTVMAKIVRHPRLQMAYLTRLFKQNQGAEYADQAVRLYAEHDRKMLMPFLKKNENYQMKRALELCKQKKYLEEVIFLLSKGGSHREALDLVLQKPENLNKAIEYCKETDDSDLWDHLIDKVSTKPEHISKLLNLAGSSVDPLKVIEKIGESVQVPGLRDSLCSVLADYASRVRLHEGCRESTLADTRLLLSTFVHREKMAIPVRRRHKCTLCERRLLKDDPMPDLQTFGCGHVIHLDCYKQAVHKSLVQPNLCPTCSEKNQG
ncbi:hypothetical protein WR25_16354 isoform A [Diploscapter pachys]|uniref:RING-type domain-containing protein n=2 Tax=Diploscapter pachys TaxID=2018661 RepID=A0A2A2LAY2_9BILA|nr:hypothetical protein WR25_16354 isoform A [Diploscapter pachys]